MAIKMQAAMSLDIKEFFMYCYCMRSRLLNNILID